MATPSRNSVSVTTYAVPSDTVLASLLDGVRWGSGGIGAGVDLTYSFATTSSTYNYQNEWSGGSVLSSTEQQAVRDALAEWSKVADITFTEVSDNSSVVGELRFAQSTRVDAGNASAWSYLPDQGVWAGDVWLSPTVFADSKSNEPGGWNFATLTHEIGHALGFKHPFETGTYSSTVLPTELDYYHNTIMSYSAYPGDERASASIYPTTLMLYDIVAIQYLYGTNTDYNSGDTTYTYYGTGEYLETIWDGGGQDFIVYSSSTAGTIDLNAGYFSSLGQAVTYSNGESDSHTVAIAYNCVIENAIGGEGGDTILGNEVANLLYGQGGNDTVIAGNGDYVDGGTGTDTVQFSAGGTLTVTAVEAVTGSSGGDWVTLVSAGAISLSAVETLLGSGGADVVTLTAATNTLIMAAVETLYGGSGADSVSLGARGGASVLAYVETVTGGSGADWVTLGSSGALTLSAVETLLGSDGVDIVGLAATSNTLTMAAIEWLYGNVGGDAVTLGARGGSVVLTAIETINGGSGADWVTLGSASAVSLSGVETLLGSSGSDTVTLTASANTLIMAAIESLTGGTGADSISLGARGGSVSLTSVETITGGSGADWISLGSAATVALSGVETLLGSLGSDVVTLGGGATITLAAVDTLTGSASADAVTLGDRGNTITIQGIDTVTGGSSADTITLADTTAVTIRYASASTGGDTILGFDTATDSVVITGSLLSTVDANGSGSLTVASRASGAVTATDEAVVLSSTISSLSGDSYSAFRSALGTLPTEMAGRSLLVVANDGTNTGLYLVTPGSDSIVDASEVTLLARFQGSLLSTSDIG